MYIIVTALPLQCLHFFMYYASSYMEAYFILILPFFFLSRFVSTKPLHHSFLLDTTEGMHGGKRSNLVEQATFDQMMSSYEMTRLKQKLLAINDLEKHFRSEVKSNKIGDDTRDRDLTLGTEKNGPNFVENNSSDVDQTYWVEVNHTVYNFSRFYRKEKKSFISSSPEDLSLNSQNYKMTSLGKHNVPFSDTIHQTVAQSSHDRTIPPRRTEKTNRKSYHVAEGESIPSISSDFDLVPPSHPLGNPSQTHGTHPESETTDEMIGKAESTEGVLFGLRIASQPAAKASRLESENLSSSDEPSRSEEQLEVRSGMSDLDVNDKIQYSNDQANVRYEETMDSDRSKESRRGNVDLDQAMNMPSVQTKDNFTEENWDKLSNEMVDIYDHVEMMREDEGDVSGVARDGLSWRQNEGFPRASNTRFDNDVSVNSSGTSGKDNVNANSYLRDKLRVGFPSRHDQQLKENRKESIRTYMNQSKLIKGKWFFEELEKKYRKMEKPVYKISKLRDESFSYVQRGFEFDKPLDPSGHNPKIVNETFDQWKLNIDTGKLILGKLKDTELKTSPSYSSSIEKVNLSREDEKDSNKILDKQNAPPNLKFDYISVDARKSIENDSIRRPEVSLRENLPVARYLSKTRKTQTQHLLRKRRDLKGENSTLPSDTITSLTIIGEEGLTSFEQVTTISSFTGQSEEAITMETELIDVMMHDEAKEDTNSSKKTVTKEKNSVQRVRGSLGSVNLVVSIQSDSSILYVMPSLVLLTLVALAAEGVRRWRTIQKAQARVRLLPPSGGVKGDFTIDNPLAFDPDVPSTSKSQPGTSSEDSGSPGIGKGPFTISHSNEIPIFNTFPHRSRRMTQDRSSSFDSSRQCCCTWCLIKSNDVQTTRL